MKFKIQADPIFTRSVTTENVLGDGHGYMNNCNVISYNVVGHCICNYY